MIEQTARVPRRRARRPVRADPGGARALALRPPRVGAVRRDHPAAVLLSDADRDRVAPRRSCPRSRARAQGRGGGRVRRRIGRPRPRSCWRRSRRPPTSPSIFPATISSDSAAELQQRFPALDVIPVVADFARPFTLPGGIEHLPKLGFFPGSTIGNFVPRSATDLLRQFRELLGDGAQLLIGMDRVKPVERLIAAYDDPEGVTAAVQPEPARAASTASSTATFRSMPSATKRGGTTYCRGSKCIWSPRATSSSRSPARRFRFAAGSSIHTENSHKYGPRGGARAVARRRLDPGRRMDRSGAAISQSSSPRRSRTVSRRDCPARRPRLSRAHAPRPFPNRHLSLTILFWIILIQVILSWLFAFNVLNTSSPGVRAFVARARSDHGAALPADPPDHSGFRRPRFLAARGDHPDPDRCKCC